MKPGWERALVYEASDRNYVQTLLPLLEGAKREITLSFYLMEPDEKAGPAHPVNRLFESLLQARSRGVEVKLYLNTNFRFRPKTEVARGNYFERLLEAGCQVTTLLPNRRLHDKLIVIDGRFVVEGSMNWSVAALESNFESVSIIDSRAHAKKKLERIAQMYALPAGRAPDQDTPLLDVPETIEFPVALLEKDGLPKMIRTSDERAFDLYLLLWGQAQARGRLAFEIDLETLGKSLAVPPQWTRSQIRRQMVKVLKKLSAQYGFLEAKFPFGKNVLITLREIPGKRIPVPGWVVGTDYLSKESTAAVFLSLAREALRREGIEIDSLSAPQLESRFGVGASTLLRARSEINSPGRAGLSSIRLRGGKH